MTEQEIEIQELRRELSDTQATLKWTRERLKEVEAARDTAAADIKLNKICAVCSKRVGEEWYSCPCFEPKLSEAQALTCDGFLWRGHHG